ncbi:MAG: MBL fold metallo-hydrolase [Promethearchaeota archaeon]
MVFINSDGKFNDNTYLIDGLLFGLNGTMSVYVIENDGLRMMIDTSAGYSARKIIKKLQELNIFPIHKIFFTHSHWDHFQGAEKIKKAMKDIDVEFLASEKAIDNLKNPDKINSLFDTRVDPVLDVTPLKEGDIIDLNGLKLEVLNFFGHTMDSIALLDSKNKNIFVGDTVIDRLDYDTFQPTFMPSDFYEPEVLKSFQKLRELRDKYDSISLAHYGVWAGEECDRILNEMEDLHFQTKYAIIKWYNEDSSMNYIASQYFDTFIPNSKIFTKEHLGGLELQLEWLTRGLRSSGFIS